MEDNVDTHIEKFAVPGREMEIVETAIVHLITLNHAWTI